MIIEFEINGARVIITGDNLTVNVTQDDATKSDFVAKRSVADSLPTPEQIKDLRKSLALTQSGFAQMLRVSQGTVCRWELGTDQPNGEAAIRIANMIREAFSTAEVRGLAALRAWINGERGRAVVLADQLGITRAAIPQWREVPADKLISVERITGIKRQVLRPDLFEGLEA